MSKQISAIFKDGSKHILPPIILKKSPVIVDLMSIPNDDDSEIYIPFIYNIFNGIISIMNGEKTIKQVNIDYLAEMLQISDFLEIEDLYNTIIKEIARRSDYNYLLTLMKKKLTFNDWSNLLEEIGKNDVYLLKKACSIDALVDTCDDKFLEKYKLKMTNDIKLILQKVPNIRVDGTIYRLTMVGGYLQKMFLNSQMFVYTYTTVFYPESLRQVLAESNLQFDIPVSEIYTCLFFTEFFKKIIDNKYTSIRIELFEPLIFYIVQLSKESIKLIINLLILVDLSIDMNSIESNGSVESSTSRIDFGITVLKWFRKLSVFFPHIEGYNDGKIEIIKILSKYAYYDYYSIGRADNYMFILGNYSSENKSVLDHIKQIEKMGLYKFADPIFHYRNVNEIRSKYGKKNMKKNRSVSRAPLELRDPLKFIIKYYNLSNINSDIQEFYEKLSLFLPYVTVSDFDSNNLKNALDSIPEESELYKLLNSRFRY
jgi:hypothetical protein